MQKDFYILAIDGGALKGVIPLELLRNLEHRAGLRLLHTFQMFAGTSTGSIIATGVASALTASELLQLYLRIGPVIFKKHRSAPIDALHKFTRILSNSVYDNEVLTKHFKVVLRDLTFKDLLTYLVIPYVNLTKYQAATFANTTSDDESVKLYHAVLCSCCAPILFCPEQVNGNLVADGGLFANNPTLQAIMRAHKDLGIPYENIKVLSVGCGHAKEPYQYQVGQKWGLLKAWQGMKLLDTTLYIQRRAVNDLAIALLGAENVFELELETSRVFNLDNADEMAQMQDEADVFYSYKHYDILRFLGIKS